MKRFLTLVLACAMLLAVLPVAAEEVTYKTLYSGEVTTLNYLTTTTTNEFGLAANLVDTLVETDRYGQIQPSLAEKWEQSEDGLTWTFYLRKDQKWVTGDGEVYADVTAHDFVASAQYILNAANASTSASILYGVVAGAEAYYAGTSTPTDGATAAPATEWDTVGIKALDDYTLQYTLTDPVPYFLSMLPYVCFMPVSQKFLDEKGDQFGLATGNDTLLYNGAFVLAEFKPQEIRVLKKNTANWDADNVFLDVIEQKYNKEAGTIAPELYLRGEVDAASIDATIAKQWLADPEKADMIRPVRQYGTYSYFYCFNFKPEFDAAYEPENWKLAVNNDNFRFSIAHALDRVKAMLVHEPDNPEAIIFNTVTPPNFVDLNGEDFTQMEGLKALTDLGPKGWFDEAKAKEYRDKAKEELLAAGATLPVKALMSYNPSSTSWAEECQIVEQQIEELLGSDYIDIIIEAGPSSGFLKAVRRSGNYALLKCNWGSDYSDPQTYTDPFAIGSNYNFPEYATGTLDEEYHALLDEALAIKLDMPARYAAFAKAEAFLINNAFIIPFGYGSGGYTAGRLNPFEGQYASSGLSTERYKGQRLLDKPMNTEQYYEAYDQWLEERAKLADTQK